MRELRAAWTHWHTAALAVVVFLALVPAAPPSWVHVDALASGLYLALAATGLWLAVGLGGLPSLGQGAFMAIGAFTVALLTARSGWPTLPAVLVGVAAAAVAGVGAGIGVVRLRPVFIAVTTWILTWAVALFLVAFPSVSGGGHGIVVPSVLSVSAHYELALALVVASILAAASLARGRVGIELRAARQPRRRPPRSASRQRGCGSARSSPPPPSPASPEHSRCSSRASRTQRTMGRTCRFASSSQCSLAAPRPHSDPRQESQGSRS